MQSFQGQGLTLDEQLARLFAEDLVLTYGVRLIVPSENIQLGSSVSVSVELKLYEVDDNPGDFLIEIPKSESIGNDLNILMVANGFQTESDSAVSLPIGLDSSNHQSSQSVSFRLTPLRPGNSKVVAEIYLGDIFKTSLEKTIDISELEETVVVERNIRAEPRPVPLPDLILQIQSYWNESESAFSFRYCLKSFRTSSLLSSEVVYRSQTFPIFWFKQIQTILRSLLQAGGADFEMRSNLASYGQNLYQQLLPPDLQTDLRNLNRYPIQTLLIQTDQDAQFPWSLLHNGQEFLGERFIIGHWLWNLSATYPYEFPVGAINVAHYANIEQPETWATLLEPPGAPSPLMLTDGVVDFNSIEAMRGLHLLRLGQMDTDASRQDAPIPLDESLEEQSLDQKIRPIKLNLRRNRPLVTLGFLRSSEPELTDLSQTWASTFLRAGCSAFAGPLWAVNPATESTFISSFYHALWAGDSLGGAFHTARRMARAVNPESIDWLAYCLFGDPMARPYRPVPGQGYAVVEPVGQDITDPIASGSTVRFRVTLRRTPPIWHEERVIEVAENLTFDNLQAHVLVFDLQIIPSHPIQLKLTPSGNYVGWFKVVAPRNIDSNDALVQVQIMNGILPIHSLTFSLNIQTSGE